VLHLSVFHGIFTELLHRLRVSDSLTLPVPEAGDFVEITLQYMKKAMGFKGLLQSRRRKIADSWTHNVNFINSMAWRLHNQSHIKRHAN